MNIIERLYFALCMLAIFVLQTAIFVTTLGATGRFAWAIISNFVLGASQ